MQKTKFVERNPFLGGMELTRNSKVIDIVVIALIIPILQSFVLAQAISDTTTQANIYATHIASNFPSNINPARYYTDPGTNKSYYLIGSVHPGFEHTKPNEITPVVANTTGIIQPASNTNTSTIVSKIRPIQSVTNFTKPAHLATNVHNALFSIIDNKTEPTVINVYKILFKIINNKNLPVPNNPVPHVAPGDAGKTEELPDQKGAGYTGTYTPKSDQAIAAGMNPYLPKAVRQDDL